MVADMSWNASQVCGPISIPVYGDPDPETGEAPITGHEPGYHINVAPELATAELEPFRIYPATPAVVWAGDESVWSTVFLRFDDEAAARAALPGLWISDI
jgi:hypothetical protein